MIHRSSNPLLLFLLLHFNLLTFLSTEAKDDLNGAGGIGGRRLLLSFKETSRGTNTSFDCSPSGPCLPCLYSEKGDEMYRCSETGYRIPIKCVEIKGGVKEVDNNNNNDGMKKPQKNRSAMEIPSDETTTTTLSVVARRGLLDDSVGSLESSGGEAYITYRSCIPPVSEIKLSVVGFEANWLRY